MQVLLNVGYLLHELARAEAEKKGVLEVCSISVVMPSVLEHLQLLLHS
jgi:hypothetical protein